MVIQWLPPRMQPHIVRFWLKETTRKKIESLSSIGGLCFQLNGCHVFKVNTSVILFIVTPVVLCGMMCLKNWSWHVRVIDCIFKWTLQGRSVGNFFLLLGVFYLCMSANNWVSVNLNKLVWSLKVACWSKACQSLVLSQFANLSGVQRSVEYNLWPHTALI